MEWEIVIGLETHAQLSTKSKIFSNSSTAFGSEPNTQASAIDMALPGTLPVFNEAAADKAIRFGLAVGAEITPRSVFARKNYFYPDLPKNYQTSQFDLPVVVGGKISFFVGEVEHTINLTRAHLEEDAGKSLHENFTGPHGESSTGIDLNQPAGYARPDHLRYGRHRRMARHGLHHADLHCGTSGRSSGLL